MELSIVSVSPAERRTGALNKDTLVAAVTALHETGAVVLRGAFPAESIEALGQEFSARYGGLDLTGMQALSQRPPPNPVQNVGEGRFEVALRMTGGFGQPGLLANGIVISVLTPLLTKDLMRLASVTAVASFPGAQIQTIHRDHQQLFQEHPQIGPALPAYAVNVSVPLIDVGLDVGPTAIWPGSHRWPEGVEGKPEDMARVPFQRGDCVMIDYRTLHAGLPNNSRTVRPILYLVYTREWFFDDNNHRGRAPLDIPLEAIRALPPEMHLLMMRAFQQAVRVQQMTNLPA